MRHAMIMAGGAGTRLWPMSRIDRPKQLIPFLPGGRSLLQLAIERIKPLVENEACRWICTNEVFRQSIVEQLKFHSDHLLGEPVGRDTLNAVAFSAAVLAQHDPDAIMAVLTADHVIEPIDQFVAAMRTGYEVVEANPETLVTFSIVPDHPATGFGYIERGQQVTSHQSSSSQPPAFDVRQYVEKPDLETAQEYLRAGTFGWSSGMFVFHVGAILDVIARYQPECHEGVMQIAREWVGAGRQPTLEEIYPTLPRISIDFAIMEPASTDPDVPVATVPMDLTWLDVGSWPSFAQTVEADKNGNRLSGGHALIDDCHHVLAVCDDPNHTLALIGCKDLIVIHTQDATLVCPADRAQDIKRLVDRLPDGLR